MTTGHSVHIPVPRQLPDLDKCQAKWAGFDDYADCLVAQPERCIFALRFGDGHLCMHVQRQEIIARSNAAGTVHRLD